MPLLRKSNASQMIVSPKYSSGPITFGFACADGGAGKLFPEMGFANPRWRGIVPLSSPSEYYADAYK